VFVPLIFSLSILTFVGWMLLIHFNLILPYGADAPFSKNFVFALLNAIAVMVVACPCALGLATPTAVVSLYRFKQIDDLNFFFYSWLALV